MRVFLPEFEISPKPHSPHSLRTAKPYILISGRFELVDRWMHPRNNGANVMETIE
jgi:hypothetical protein